MGFGGNFSLTNSGGNGIPLQGGAFSGGSAPSAFNAPNGVGGTNSPTQGGLFSRNVSFPGSSIAGATSGQPQTLPNLLNSQLNVNGQATIQQNTGVYPINRSNYQGVIQQGVATGAARSRQLKSSTTNTNNNILWIGGIGLLLILYLGK